MMVEVRSRASKGVRILLLKFFFLKACLLRIVKLSRRMMKVVPIPERDLVKRVVM